MVPDNSFDIEYRKALRATERLKAVFIQILAHFDQDQKLSAYFWTTEIRKYGKSLSQLWEIEDFRTVEQYVKNDLPKSDIKPEIPEL